MSVEDFAKTFLGQLVIEFLFENGRLDTDWSNGADPDEMASVPPAKIRMHEIEDAVGDAFHHEGDNVCLAVFKRMPSDALKAYFSGPVRHTVAHAVLARCESGEVYKTNYAARAPVRIDGVELAPNFSALRKEASQLASEEVEAFYAGR